MMMNDEELNKEADWGEGETRLPIFFLLYN